MARYPVASVGSSTLPADVVFRPQSVSDAQPLLSPVQTAPVSIESGDYCAACDAFVPVGKPFATHLLTGVIAAGVTGVLGIKATSKEGKLASVGAGAVAALVVNKLAADVCARCGGPVTRR